MTITGITPSCEYPAALRVEQAALNSWPALQTLLYDGWILRFAEGYTKRSNSVTALFPSTLPVEAKIAFCEQCYRERGLRPMFRLASCCAPTELDAALQLRGYAPLDPTLVLTRALEPVEASASVSALPLDDWLPHYVALSGADPARQPSHARLLRQITTPRLNAALLDDAGQPVAAGLCVVEGDLTGVFDLVVAPTQRRRGHGRHLMQGMLAWAASQGAHWAYLQVMENNPAARALYASLGFRPCYDYWYRVAP